MTRDLALQLNEARAAFERVSQQPPKPGAVLLEQPACDRRCEQCNLTCAVVAGAVADLGREAAAAGVILSHDGIAYGEPAGRA